MAATVSANFRCRPGLQTRKSPLRGIHRSGLSRSLKSGRFLPETPPGRCCAETLRFPSASEKRQFAAQVNQAPAAAREISFVISDNSRSCARRFHDGPNRRDQIAARGDNLDLIWLRDENAIFGWKLSVGTWQDAIDKVLRLDAFLLSDGADDRLNRLAETEGRFVVWGAQMPDQLYCSVGSDNLADGRYASR